MRTLKRIIDTVHEHKACKTGFKITKELLKRFNQNCSKTTVYSYFHFYIKKKLTICFTLNDYH